MNLNEFRDWALAQGSVGKYTDGQYVGECVSLINQGLARMYGIEAGAWGHAKSWANDTNPIRQWFDPVATSQPGDIGVYTGGEFGHIWWYLDGQILEQNGRVARKVTLSPDRNATIILRHKGGTPGGNMPFVEQSQIDAWLHGPDGIDHWKTQSAAQADQITALQAENAELKKQVAGGSSGYEKVTDLYRKI